MEVGLRELRANLAAIMDAVDAGTTVTITRHGKPRATIQPAAESPLERGIREGWLSVGPDFGKRPRGSRRPRATFSLPPGVRLDDILAEDRADDR